MSSVKEKEEMGGKTQYRGQIGMTRMWRLCKYSLPPLVGQRAPVGCSSPASLAKGGAREGGGIANPPLIPP